MRRRRLPGGQRYLVLVVGALVVYTAVAVALPIQVPIPAEGPLSPDAEPRNEPLPGGIGVDEAVDACFPPGSPFRAIRAPQRDYEYEVVGGTVGGQPYYACYALQPDGDLSRAELVTAEGEEVDDLAVYRAAGVWRHRGVVKTPGELVLGGVGVAVVFGFGWVYYRRPRPGPPPAERRGVWEQPVVHWMLLLVPFVGWALLGVWPGLARGRRARLMLQGVWVWTGIILGLVTIAALSRGDPWGRPVLLLLLASFVATGILGRLWLAPPGFDAPAGARAASAGRPWPDTSARPDGESEAAARGQSAPAPGAQAASEAATTPSGPPADDPPAERAPAQAARGASRRTATDEQGPFTVTQPGSLPTFADVGGMEDLKTELTDTFGLLLAFAGEAERFRIEWNGVLLYGPPGVGKSHLVRALAGEFGMSLLHVQTGDLVSSYRGAAARNIDEAFRAALAHMPAVLFFDEFDSIAQSRSDWPDQEARRTVNQLLQSLEAYRGVPEQVVVAATNDPDGLDPAVVRPGRFDRRIRVDLPDQGAREAILRAQLRERPVEEDVDVADVARQAAGLTPAALTQVVERAALAAFRATTAGGELVHLDTGHLRQALAARGGADRPTVEDWSWDRLVLPQPVVDELRQLQRLVEDPERARAVGVDPPSGVLLTGPPGTGKTTVARVLAAEARCSFYPISAADLKSKWVGESEQNVERLFDRARENQPSIVFIDEIDAVAGRRHGWSGGQGLVNQLLAAIDGMDDRGGVLVLGATNRPDELDPAIRRGGRLSRTIHIPAPDADERRQLLELFTADMPLVGVDLRRLAEATAGMAGADLEALCQQAALHALVRVEDSDEAARVTPDDFDVAAAALSAPDPSPSAEQNRPHT